MAAMVPKGICCKYLHLTELQIQGNFFQTVQANVILFLTRMSQLVRGHMLHMTGGKIELPILKNHEILQCVERKKNINRCKILNVPALRPKRTSSEVEPQVVTACSLNI